MSDAVTAQDLIPYMPLVGGYERTLRALGGWWQKVTLIGKINSLQVAATLLEEMGHTRKRFEQLQGRLIEALAAEHLRKVELELGARAQVAIDILVRNLFERTADVGFLATDGDLRAFLRLAAPAEQEREAIRERLREYTAKYSVYDEIVVLDCAGRVRAHLDPDNPITFSRDPLIEQTLATSAPYLETFRASDLRPLRRTALIYSAPIRADDGPRAELLGVLCLCFRLEDELAGIFSKLRLADELIAILDAEGRVIGSSDEQQLPSGRRLRTSPHGIQLIDHGGERALARSAATGGYQGYFGLGWQGQVMVPAHAAFRRREGEGARELLATLSRHFSEELRAIRRSAALVTDDLILVVLNGQIISAKNDAKEFMPVLDEIRHIGNRTRGVFEESIGNLYETVLSALLSEVQFQAFLAVDIMDRNLYERANDVRWWALTSRFRALLAAGAPGPEARAELSGILAHINSLYTVYTNLILFDERACVLALSNPAQGELIGRTLSDPWVHCALALTGSERYVVSPFAATPLYDGRPTYLYASAIRAPDDPQRVVGGIGIVFDAQPQFAAMLETALPKEGCGRPRPGAFAIFLGADGRLIAATRPDLRPGERFPIDADLLALPNGARASRIVAFEGSAYALGAAMSQGYREYKTSGDYKNDVLGVVMVPV